MTSGTLTVDRALRTHTAFLDYIKRGADMEIIMRNANFRDTGSLKKNPKTKIKEVILVSVKQRNRNCRFCLQKQRNHNSCCMILYMFYLKNERLATDTG